MDTFIIFYLVTWITIFLISIVLLFKSPKNFSICTAHYWKFLFKPWKVVTFIIAATGITLVAPYTGDPTWDYADALFMSILTFTTAPWVVGTLYSGILKKSTFQNIYVAICFWLFSASWSYDLYLLVRDGHYPETWSANLGASSILYLLGGMFWNLIWSSEKGISFAFLSNSWLADDTQTNFKNVLWMALPFMIFATILVFYFLID